MKKFLTALCLALGLVFIAACGADNGGNTNLKKDEAIAEVQSYVRYEDYREEQRDELDALIATYIGKINGAASQDEIDGLVLEAKSKLDDVKTDAELDAEEDLAAAKSAAKSGLASYVDKDDYRTAEKARIEEILAEADAAIDGAADEAAVGVAVQSARDKLNALKTDAELSAAELAEAKASAKSELASYADKDAYRSEQQHKIDEILAAANDAIDGAADEAGIQAAVSAAQGKLDALPTDEQLTEAEHLNGLKTQKKGEVASYKSRGDYRAKEQEDYDRILREANEAIDEALTEQAIDEAVASAKAQLETLKTAAEYEQEEAAALASVKQGAKDTLKSRFDKADFLDDDWKKIEGELAGYNARIDEAADADAVQSIVDEAEEALDATWVPQKAYKINVEAKGSGHIVPEEERAKAGTVVVFACEADVGNRAYNGSLTVKTAGGDELSVTRASFTMPQEEVTIFVTFVKDGERGVPVRLTSPEEQNPEGHKLGWESTTESGWDGWPPEANKQSVCIDGFGYINNLTIHGKPDGEVGFTYNLETLGEKYEYFSAEVGIHFDATNNFFTTMHVIVRFQKQGSETWDEAAKILIYAMQSPTLLRVKIPEDAVKMQLYADPGDPGKDGFPNGNNFDIIVWGNPMLYNGTLGENVDSLALATVPPAEATTGFDNLPAHVYGVKSYPGYGFLPTIAGKTYRDGFITHGTGVAGEDKGFTFDITDICGEGGLDTLVGFAGLQDDPNYTGEAKLVIMVDGVVKFEKVMETGEEAVPVRIPVLGAKELKLLIADSDGIQNCDVCVFAEMTLIRETAHPIDKDTVLLSDLEYEGTTFWPLVEAKFYSVYDIVGRRNERITDENPNPPVFYAVMSKVNGRTVDGGFITHTDSNNPAAWHGFTFDLKGEAFDTLIGSFGVVDTADIGGAFTAKQEKTKMAYKILADMGNGEFDTELVPETVIDKDTVAAINVSVKGAKRIQLLMSSGPDAGTTEGDLGIFTGMYLTKTK